MISDGFGGISGGMINYLSIEQTVSLLRDIRGLSNEYWIANNRQKRSRLNITMGNCKKKQRKE